MIFYSMSFISVYYISITFFLSVFRYPGPLLWASKPLKEPFRKHYIWKNDPVVPSPRPEFFVGPINFKYHHKIIRVQTNCESRSLLVLGMLFIKLCLLVFLARMKWLGENASMYLDNATFSFSLFVIFPAWDKVCRKKRVPVPRLCVAFLQFVSFSPR